MQHGGPRVAAGALSIQVYVSVCVCLCVWVSVCLCVSQCVCVCVCVSLVAFAACLTRLKFQRSTVRGCCCSVCICHAYKLRCCYCVQVSVCVCVCVSMCVCVATLSPLLCRFVSQNRLKCHLYALNVACGRELPARTRRRTELPQPMWHSGHDGLNYGI